MADFLYLFSFMSEHIFLISCFNNPDLVLSKMSVASRLIELDLAMFLSSLHDMLHVWLPYFTGILTVEVSHSLKLAQIVTYFQRYSKSL